MTIIFRTNAYNDQIEEFEVAQRTPKRVTTLRKNYRGEEVKRTESFNSRSHQYHDTREDALRCLLRRAKEMEEMSRKGAVSWADRASELRKAFIAEGKTP